MTDYKLCDCGNPIRLEAVRCATCRGKREASQNAGFTAMVARLLGFIILPIIGIVFVMAVAIIGAGLSLGANITVLFLLYELFK